MGTKKEKSTIFPPLAHAKLIVNEAAVKHSLAAPSSFENILQCPYYAKNKKKLGERTSEAAERGRKMHEAVYNDEVLNTLSEEDKAIVLGVRQRSIYDYDKEGYVIEFEVPVEIKDASGKVITTGTIDTLIYKEGGDTFLTKDNKFGSMPVAPASRNEQLKPYVVGVFQKFPNFKKGFCQIEQPSCPDNGDMFGYEREKDYERLLKFVSEVCEIAHNAKATDATPCEACRWCAKSECSVYKSEMDKACKEYALTLVNDDTLANLPKEELVAYCDNALAQMEFTESVIKESKAIAKKIILAAGGSENYKLIYPSMRKTVDYKRLVEDLGVSQEKIDEYTTYTDGGEPYVRRRTNRKK